MLLICPGPRVASTTSSYVKCAFLTAIVELSGSVELDLLWWACLSCWHVDSIISTRRLPLVSRS